MDQRTLGYYDTKPKDTNFRRTWDRAEYERRARERDRETREAVEDEDRRRKGLAPLKRPGLGQSRSNTLTQRRLLQGRTEKLDLEAQLGQTRVVQSTTEASKQPGFYCKVCDCVVKDSVAYLDHINGKNHQRNLGMSMKVERSTLEQVRARLQMLKAKKKETVKEYDIEERIRQLKEKDQEEKRQRRQRRKDKKRTATAVPDGDIDPNIAAMMG
ncbi:U4/U6.U5 snRNP associated protein [Dispira simplex]|nr:U4/U6.U5 snRNP associated protein [Dispira simplex]